MALSFIKTGKDSAALAAQAAAEAEMRKDQYGKAFRYWLNPAEEGQMTFVDGDLSDEGFLLPPRWWEHSLYLNGQWGNNFVCPEKTNPELKDPCPICAAGDRPSLVSAFTIIDHRPYTVKSGKNQGKIYQNTRKLLIATSISFEVLNKLAIKRGGLAGCKFDVSRMDKKSARIGSMFDFVDKKPVAELKALYTEEHVDPKTNQKSIISVFEPLDYSKEVIYRTGEELTKMGLGKPIMTMASPGGMVMPPQSGAPVDYSAQL
jgi:hypothetical protein